jgi:SAM-dependent methyltransferase
MNSEAAIEIIEVPCPLCSNPDTAVLFNRLEDVEDRVPGVYSISRCARCQLVYLSRRPTEASLPKCYPAHYHVVDSGRRNVLADFLYGIRLALRCAATTRAAGTCPRAILEIGCGDGSFLQYLDRHLPRTCSLTGIDYLVPPLEKPSSRLNLIQGEIENVDFSQKFDVAVMFNVLEHVADPVKVLKRLHSMMEPGGVVFGEVPNWNSPWRRLFPRHWQGLQIPRHQTHFAPDTLQAVFQAAGFERATLTPVYDPGDLAVTFCNWLSDTLGLETPPRKAWFYLPVVLLSAPIVWLVNRWQGDSGSTGFTARKGGPRG